MATSRPIEPGPGPRAQDPARSTLRFPPFHLSRRLGRKGRLTALGIALCVSFAVLSFTLVEGLEESLYDVSESHRDGRRVLARPGLEPFLPPSPAGNATAGLLVEARLADGSAVSLVAFEGPGAPPVEDGAYLAPPAVALPDPLEIELPERAVLVRHHGDRGPDAAATWTVASPGTLRALDHSLADGRVSFVLLREAPTESEARRYSAMGLDVSVIPGILPFFQSGAGEVARDLWVVVAFTSLLVGLLCYEFMHLEARAKRREIGIWRALGLHRGGVLAVLLAEAALLSLLGSALGIAGASAALLAARRATGLEFLDALPSPGVGLAVAAATAGAALLGALVPAWSAARRPVREAIEEGAG